MRVAVIGGTESALELLKLLTKSGIKVFAVLLQIPDSHEDKTAFDSSLNFLENEQIPYLTLRSFSEAAAHFLVENSIDVACLINCRFLIKEKFLGIPKYGFLVTHGSLLPEYRGFAPLNWAIINGCKKIGISLFKACENVDSGPILARREFAICDETTATDLFQKFVKNQPEMFLEFLNQLQCAIKNSNANQYVNELFERQPQDENAANYCCRRLPIDSLINFNESAENALRLIRASQPPYPFAFTHFDNEPLEILMASRIKPFPKYAGISPGRVVSTNKKTGWVDVLCNDGPIRLQKVRFRGLEAKAADLITSTKITLGMNFFKKIEHLENIVTELLESISSKN
jgi:methionyl-tRNA formyltransferase